MHIKNFLPDADHLIGDGATHPIAQCFEALAALLLLAGISRSHLCAVGAHRRPALPAPRITAHSGGFNYRIQVQ